MTVTARHLSLLSTDFKFETISKKTNVHTTRPLKLFATLKKQTCNQHLETGGISFLALTSYTTRFTVDNARVLKRQLFLRPPNLYVTQRRLPRIQSETTARYFHKCTYVLAGSVRHFVQFYLKFERVLLAALGALCSTQPLTDLSTRNIS